MSRSLPRSPVRRLTLALLAGAVALSTVAPAAAAQGIAGRIKRKAAEVAAEKGAEKAVNRASGGPTFDEDVLEITDARVDQLLKGLAAERATALRVRRAYVADSTRAAQQNEAYYRRQREFSTREDAYARCSDSVQKANPSLEAKRESAAAAGRSDVDRLESMRPKLEAMQKRAVAAQQRGDYATAKLLSDSLMMIVQGTMAGATAQGAGFMLEANKVGAQVTARCGAPPERPNDPDPPAMPLPPRQQITEAAVTASGLTERQYVVLRERAGAYTIAEGRFASGSLWAYTDKERDTLGRRLGELRPYRARFGGTPDTDLPAGW